MELGLRLECVRERERELGTVPAQTDPDTLSYRGEVNWVRETVRYIPLKESEIVAPGQHVHRGGSSGMDKYTESDRVDVFVGEALWSSREAFLVGIGR